MIELETADVRVHLAVEHGGRIAQITVGGTDLLHTDPRDGSLTWGSYPMAPWAGRVRNGRFEFDGRLEQLPVNLPPHAIHGTVSTKAWTVVDAGRDYCELETDLDWQFGGRAHQHLHLAPEGLTCVLGVLATTATMPAVVGWHPCFRKPAGDELHFRQMLHRDEHHMATAELRQPAPRPWDDCFVEPLGPLRLHHPALTVTVDSDCSHWVLYDEPAHLLCVEPQSGPPDAFNIGGAVRLEPGELLQRTMTIGWRRHSG
jgi:aldose 1-epimerase